MVKQIMQTMNGHKIRVALVLVVPFLSWASYVTYGTIANTKWAEGHMAWTETTFGGVLRDLKRIEDTQTRIEQKLDGIVERLSRGP